MRDQKNNFYRTLDLPKEEKDILRWYRSVIKEIKNSAEMKINTIKESKSND